MTDTDDVKDEKRDKAPLPVVENLDMLSNGVFALLASLLSSLQPERELQLVSKHACGDFFQGLGT
jgi:hypothetical protein